MSGVTSTALGLTIVGVLVVLLFGGGFVWALPILVVGALIAAIGPAMRFFAERGAPGTDEPAVPSTREASYEPVEPRRPSEQ